MFRDFISLIYPQVCMACGNTLFKNENCICTYCHFHLPKTNYHLYNDNPVMKLFWGRASIHSAASYFTFNKGGKVQNLIHELKYKGQQEVGVVLGRLYGLELKKSASFNTSAVIIPVPLHKAKQKKRGFNQSECFGKGLSDSLDIEMDTEILKRINASDTQTKKSRFNRWKNVETIFKVNEPEKIMNKHILLVDDVVTTGSTLEACAQKLLEIPGTKVSIATIAYAAI